MRFRFEYQVSAFLDEEALWPDGDAPESPTVLDVLALVEKCGGPEKVLRDWNMLEDFEFEVTEMER